MTTPFRARIQAQRNLRRLFENLTHLRKDRPSTLTEIPIPSAQPKKKPKALRSRALKDPPPAVIPNLARPLVLNRPINGAPAVERKIRKWESVEEIQNAVLDEGEGGGERVDVRIFEQTVRGRVDMIDGGRIGGFAPMEGYVLKRLEKALLLLERNPVVLKKEIFYWLGRARAMPRVLKSLTEYAWKTIWALETGEIPTSRSKLVGDLMIAAQVPLSEEQEIAYIGGLFWNDARAQAMERWRNRIKVGPASRAFWNLGVRLLALAQKPEAAYYTIQKMEEHLVPINYRDYVPVIMAYNHIGQPTKAREAYKRMKKFARENGYTIKTKAYDDISMSFLDAGEMDRGLSIYKEMIFAGNKSLFYISTDDAMGRLSAADAAEGRLPEKLQDGPQEPNLAYMSLEELRKLPYEKWDQYFIEGWMQSLLRMGRADLVYILITSELPKRGFPTDSVHFNWAIKGFLEEGSIEMAEYVAQAMIQETIKYVQSKASPPPRPGSGEEQGEEGAVPPPSPEEREEDEEKNLITAPPATIYTFSHLILYFSRHQRMERVAAYTNLLSQCALQPNSFIYNHILYSLYRLQFHERFDKAFASMLETPLPNLHPDVETWQIAWAAHRRRLTLLRNTMPDHHRHLFREMVRTLPPQSEDEHKTIQSIWQKIVKCFVIVQDFHGLLVALHAGVKNWGVELDNTILREATIGVLKPRRRFVPDPANPGSVVRTVVGKGAVDASVAYLVRQGLRLLKRRRGAAAAGMGRKRVLEGNLSSLSELLAVESIYQPGYTSEDFSARVNVAKRDLGVEGLVIEW
ncbi:hypothetical protein C7212DRAFT_360836 [Tuber magnatum]|uniref:TPR-like protein n=1 Tax=Tuber magnatum TaxID=42249 RepID=A0A317SWW4_9PEZI|nr:hypothetical protein C7212DRAFT_360836 [Tuber magnatum]